MKDIIYTRKYTDRNGNEKKEYILVGYLFEKDGRQSILLKNYINPAALANERGEVWLNAYEPKQKENKEKSIYKGKSTVDALTDALLRSKDPAKDVPVHDEDTPF